MLISYQVRCYATLQFTWGCCLSRIDSCNLIDASESCIQHRSKNLFENLFHLSAHAVHRSQGIFGDFDLFEFEGVDETIKLNESSNGTETRWTVCHGVTQLGLVTAGGHGWGHPSFWWTCVKWVETESEINIVQIGSDICIYIDTKICKHISSSLFLCIKIFR